MATARRHHLLELLFLLVVQYRFNFAFAVIADAPELCATIGLRHRRVRAQSLHLLLAVGQNRLDLRHLVSAQAELLAQMFRFASRICRAPL